MHRWTQYRLVAVFLACTTSLAADQVAVRFPEGLTHGFLVVHDLSGKFLAEGDLTEVVQNDRVDWEMILRFKDGSRHEEKAVFSQRGKFRLLSYHLVQKGTSFKQPVEVDLNPVTGRVAVHWNEDGKEKSLDERLKLQPDVSNGIVPTLLKNIRPETPETTLSMVATTPKPQVVKLVVTPQGEDLFNTAGLARKAIHYVVKIKIAGIKGVIAPLVGKEPPDIHIWILGGIAPAFVKSEGPLFYGGPVWRIELTDAAWDHAPSKR